MAELQSYTNAAFNNSEPNTSTQHTKVDPEEGEHEVITFKDGGDHLGKLQNEVSSFVDLHYKHLIRLVQISLLLLYLTYLGYCLYYEFGDEGSIRLLVCSLFGIMLLALHLVSKVVTFRTPTFMTAENSSRGLKMARKILYWSLCVGMALFMVIYTAVDVGTHDTRNLVSLSGIAFFIIVLFITSKNISKVKWHPVFWGMALQYVFALIINRTEWGVQAFDYLGDRVTELLSYSNAGASFVFGNDLVNVFAFGVLPVIVYFSSLVSVLYYLGVMQAIIGVVGRFLAFCLQTSPTESLNTAANIFLSQTETPLLIRPFLPDMTKSELHAILTGGFATVAGSVLGAYISFGAKASYLLGASVMSAPAALAISKLTYPETEVSKVDKSKVFKMVRGEAHNMFEALSEGASLAIALVANIAVNLIAFLSILAFLDATLQWFGDRAGVEDLTFQLVCSYLFYPLAFMMGVDAEDCRRVGRLIGYKTFANEFIAYSKMGSLLDNFKVYQNYSSVFGNVTLEHKTNMDIVLHYDNGNTTLEGGFISNRSEVITTYALCGFSNIGSMGIMLGALTAIAPSRRADLAGLVLRALVAGSVACFMTACIAGLFYEDRS